VRRRSVALALLLVAAGAGAAAEPPVRNGFVLEPSSIPADQIVSGGPPRDGIPALEEPEAAPAGAAEWDEGEPVVGVELGGESRAYPLAILVWHEQANDSVGGVPILVSYCPLCGTAMVFDRRVGSRTHRFGVSGLLYRSDLLMFDRETESLWSQIGAEAVTGPARGARLRLLRSRIEPWGAWRRRQPETKVITSRTGHERRYGVSPYGDYALSERLLYPLEHDARYHPKMPTLGLRLADGRARGYPAEELARAGGSVAEEFAGRKVRVTYDPEQQVFDVEAPGDVDVIEGFWFAWMAFHPASSIFVAPPSEE
jgi:hypothetical protein